MKSQSLLISFAAFFLLLAAGPVSAQAQSVDSDNPTPLTSREISGQGEARGQSYFYSFTAGPGDVIVTVDSSTDYDSTNTHLIISDDNGRQLANIAVSPTSVVARKVEKFHLGRRQAIKMQLMFGLDVGIHVKYRIRLNGALGSPEDAAVGESTHGVYRDRERDRDREIDSNSDSDSKSAAGRVDRTADPVVSTVTPIEDKWALVVGISKFEKPDINLKYTDPYSLYATGLPLEELAASIKHRVHCNRVVLIIDACHSGSVDLAKGMMRVSNVDSNALLQGTGQLIICSSAPNQVSWESKRYQNGVFTHSLIDALRSQSGKATLGQAFKRLQESAQSEVLQDRSELQTAVWKSKWQGNALIISAPPTKPRAVAPELVR